MGLGRAQDAPPLPENVQAVNTCQEGDDSLVVKLLPMRLSATPFGSLGCRLEGILSFDLTGTEGNVTTF